MTIYDPFNWFWIVGDNETRFWSSAARAYVEELPDDWFPTIQAAVSALDPIDGNPEDMFICTRIGSESELDEVLAAYGLLGPTARRKVRKSIVQARLIAVGKMGEAYTVLTANPIFFARWFAPDHPEVYADDPDAIALLIAIGANPESIMAAGEEI